MIVKLKAAAAFRYYFANLSDIVDGADFEVTEGATVGEFLESINLPQDAAMVTLVNGKRADKTEVLNENDEIYLVHPIAGG
ncbi:MAG: MoaD/ThiS family protein [Deltaproteobacteria bacterium]|nr:MAG: MoaD/ThiS family protein [Deltaproteobacteria bacterium]